MAQSRERGPTGTAPPGTSIPGQRAVPPGPPGTSGTGSRVVAGVRGFATAPAHTRGLPASGAVAVAVGAGFGGGAVDVLTGSGLRAMFAVAFVFGCMLAAAVVRRRSLLTAVVTPPLAYVALALAAAAAQRDSNSSSWLMRQIFELLTALVLGAPVLLAATGAAAIVALVRLWLPRSPDVVELPPS